MSALALGFAGLAIGLLGFFVGVLFEGASCRRRLKEADARLEALRRDFDTVSTVNLQLLHKPSAKPAAAPVEEGALHRFLDLYDEAKRCLHRALDRHNAKAPRPIVINRDGANILQALTELPPLSFCEDSRKDAGLRSWLYRVLELDVERRKLRQPPGADKVSALECERELWGAVIKQCA
ncbi:MAG TPA: hypothetical protein VEA80_08925 [Vitreimonas sp.]|uniref:hypothetical protein n=1 Tax=Vitreimonas sp. TaxID=3069702 RepID=UPI002D3D7268|nr:hypothetical protein [Vitreimonas sp.]HYD87583.1 hypothetical protein [Vitreimonas sp.]